MSKELNNLDFIGEESSPGEDRTSKREEEKLYGQHRRSERLSNNINIIFIIFVWVVGIIAISAIVCRLVHLVLPPQIRWLTDSDIQGIDKLFFSGAVGGLLVNQLKKIENH
jgi:hypothetical protein